MHELASVGTALSARVDQVGDTCIISSPGIPLSAEDVSPALAFLEAQGLETTADGLIRGEHLFGRLANWKAKHGGSHR